MPAGLTLKQLQQMQQAGPLNARQQTRLGFLQNQGAQKGGGSRQNLTSAGGIIKASGQENLTAAKQTSQMSNPNVNSTLGTQNVTYDPVTGQPTVNQGLSAGQQGLYDQEMGIESGANTEAQQMAQGGIYKQPFSATGVQQAFSPIRDQVMQGLNQDFDARNKPVFDRQAQDLEQWSASTGNPPGSPNYNERMRLMQQTQNDARTAANAQAIGMGNQAVEQGFRLGQQERDRPLNEVSGLMGLGQGVQYPNFPGFTPSQVQPVDVGGIATNIMGQNTSKAIAGGNNSAAMARQLQDQKAAQDLLDRAQDQDAGGDTSDLVGGSASPARMAATKQPGSLGKMGQAIRKQRGKVRVSPGVYR